MSTRVAGPAHLMTLVGDVDGVAFGIDNDS